MKRIAIGMALMCVWAIGADGAVRYVSSVSGADTGGGTNASAPCKTIQYAVDQSGSGDEIRIATYDVQTIVFPPSIQSNRCTYTSTGATVISFGSGKSLSLKGGYVYFETGASWQQGVIPPVVDGQNARRCLSAVGVNGDTNRIELLEFSNGAADNGANVYAQGGSLQLVGTPIHGGTATAAGGGVYMSGVDFSVSLGSYSNLALPQVTGLLPIYSNSATRGGGLYLDGGYPVLTTVGVMNNTATGSGGGVYINQGSPSVVGGTIQNNTAGGDGGAIYLSNSVARVGGMIIDSNRASRGGAIFLDGPFALTMETATLIANNYIQGNVATAGKGGAIYFNLANVGVVNNVITGNTATNGAAAYLYASSPRFYQNTIADNVGDTGIYVTHDPGQGWAQIIPPVLNPLTGQIIMPGQTNLFAGIPVPSWPALTNTILSGQVTALYVDSTGNSLLEDKVQMGFTLWWSNATDIAGAGTVTHHDDLHADPQYTGKGTAPGNPMPFHIATNSPAVDVGTQVGLTLPGTDLLLDIDAQLRPSGQGMDIGADEVVTDPLSVWFVPPAIACTVRPGQVVTNQHMLLNSGTQNDTYHIAVSNSLWSGGVVPTNIAVASQSYTSITVIITVPGGAADGTTNISVVTAVSQTDSNRTAVAVDATGISTNTGGGTVRYVWQSSPTPGLPYTSPDTAGHDIQTVVDACVAGDTVLVYPGAYNAGGAVTPGYALTNRVCITNAITLTSLAGADNTQILGAADPATTNGPAAVRCLYVKTNATVSGFSLSGGHTLTSPVAVETLAGGGALLAGAAIVSNCTIVGCSANAWGGGLYGASTSVVWDTRIRACSSDNHGGAYLAVSAALYNCLVCQSEAGGKGGGIFVAGMGGIYNCTIVSNAAAVEGGGIFVNANAGVINDVIYFNSAPTNANLSKGTATIKSCCTTPDPGGVSNITANPLFADGDYHLQNNSPCIDSGTVDHAPSHDLDGNARPLDGDAMAGAAMDIGCYEVYNANGDSDGDGATDGSEAIADTDPMDPESYLRITAASNLPPWTVYFPSSSGRVYTLSCSTNLVSGPWTNVPGAGPRLGAGGADSMRDTNAPSKGSFYRVKAALP